MANLTQDDLNAIKGLIEVTLDEKLEEKFNEQLGLMPTKEEFYERTDMIVKELQDMREEMVVLSGRSSTHSDEIEELQKIHPNNKHISLASV